MTEANLQVDDLVERPVQGAADQQEMEAEDSCPHKSPTTVPLSRGCRQAVSI